MFLVVVLLGALISFLYFYSVTKPKNYPPGPKWKFAIGSADVFKECSKKYGGQHFALQELSKKWKSSILGWKLGKEHMVTVQDYPTIKDIFTKEEFDQRPKNLFTKLRTLGTFKGITCAEGRLWVEQRNFVVRHLRNIGFGKNIMDIKIHEEMKYMFKEIDSQKIVQISQLLPFTIVNVLWSLVAGSRVESSTFDSNQLLNIISKRSRAFDMSGGMLSQYPWLRFIMPEKTGYNLIKTLNKELKMFLIKTINEHHRNWTDGKNDDLIDSFITEMKKQNGKPTTFTDDQLLLICLDLFVGGFTTTSNTLDFLFLVMVLHQDVQKKIQMTLDNLFSKEQPIWFEDRHKLPYVEAVIREVQRYYNVTPILGPRRANKEVTLAGYTIPKDASVLINMHPTLTSKEIWGDPEVFRPERFLDKNNELVAYSEFNPFGIGKRKCLGDAFAKGCLFLFTTEVLRNYSILPVDQDNLPSTKPVPGLVLSPRPYFARFVRRCS